MQKNLSLKSVAKLRGIKTNAKLIRKLTPRLKVVYTDVDGTLLGPGGSLFTGPSTSPSRKYTLAPAKAIIAALKRDIDIVMVSGRNARQLQGDARILGFKNYIAELGSLLVYNLGEKTILSTAGFKVTEANPLQTMEKMGAAKLLLKHFKGSLEHHTPWSEARECTYVFRGYVNVEEAKGFLDSKGFYNLAFVDNGIISRRSETLLKSLPEIHAYHLLPKRVSKRSGVRKDRKIRKLAKNSTIAIGDAFSDLELAGEVGALFLVKNALSDHTTGIVEAVLSYPNVFVTEKPMGEGFAEAINFFI